MLVDDLPRPPRSATPTAPSTSRSRPPIPTPCSTPIDSAGAIFLGANSPVSLGDYLAGSNHVLPTGGPGALLAGARRLRPSCGRSRSSDYDREALARSPTASSRCPAPKTCPRTARRSPRASDAADASVHGVVPYDRATMFCPFCRHPDSRVIDSRTSDDGLSHPSPPAVPGVRPPLQHHRDREPQRHQAQRRRASRSAARRSSPACARPARAGRSPTPTSPCWRRRVEESIRATGASQVDANDIGLAILRAAARARRGRLPAVRERVPGVRFARRLRSRDLPAAGRARPRGCRSERTAVLSTGRADRYSGYGMYRILFRLVLSRLDPEPAHHLAFAVIRLLPAHRPRRAVCARLTRPASVASPCRHSASASPRRSASRPASTRTATASAASASSASATSRSARSPRIAQPGNPRPRLFRLDRRPRGRQPDGIQQPRRGGCAAAARVAERRRRIRGPSSASTSARPASSTSTTPPPTTSTSTTAAGAGGRLPRRQRVVPEHPRACAGCRNSTSSRRC